MGKENRVKSTENVMADQELEKKDAVQSVSDEEAEDAKGGTLLGLNQNLNPMPLKAN